MIYTFSACSKCSLVLKNIWRFLHLHSRLGLRQISCPRLELSVSISLRVWIWYWQTNIPPVMPQRSSSVQQPWISRMPSELLERRQYHHHPQLRIIRTQRHCRLKLSMPSLVSGSVSCTGLGEYLRSPRPRRVPHQELVVRSPMLRPNDMVQLQSHPTRYYPWQVQNMGVRRIRVLPSDLMTTYSGG
jgi:hypothetical protein